MSKVLNLFKPAICITSGEQSENHVDMSINGNGLAERGSGIDEHSKPKPIEHNFKNRRKARQDNNNTIVYESVRAGDLNTFDKNINRIEFERVLNDLELTKPEFVSKCKDDKSFAKLASRTISINASRQGTKDEQEQIDTCIITSQQCGIFITNLTVTELRPTKDGSIVSKKEMKIKQVQKDCCLKSFDAKISGKISGFIAAKVAYGTGGHQDNVFEEMDTIAEWWKKYKSGSEEILIILIDTDLITKITTLKEKYSNVNNVKVFNHIEFQHYMISKYYIDESI